MMQTDPYSNQPKSSSQPIFDLPFQSKETPKVVQNSGRVRKNKRKAIAMLVLSGLALSSYSIFYLYGAVSDYLRAPDELVRLDQEIKQYDEAILPTLLASKDLHKSAYDEEFKELNRALDSVLPREIDKLGIVQLLESFAVEVDAVSPPFEFTSISVNPPQEKDGYQLIPITTSIHSSLAGFDRFLELVEKSGEIYVNPAAEKKQMLEKMVRLMSISNITIKYRGIDEETGQNGGVDFNVKLNFYSRLNTDSQPATESN